LKAEQGGLLQRDLFWGIALSTLSFLLVMLVPLIGAMVVVLTPLPVLFYYTKCGRFKGVFIFGTSLALTLLVFSLLHLDILFPLVFLILVGATAAMLAEMFKRSWSIEKTLAIPAATYLISGACLLLFFSYQAQQTPGRFIEGYLFNIIGENIRLYEQLEISAEQISTIKENAAQIAALLTRIFPAVMLISSVLMILLNIWAAKPFFNRSGLHYPDFGDLTQWKPPEKLVWLLIAAGGTLLLPMNRVQDIGMNLLILCLFIYLCAGLSIIGYFFMIKRVPVFLRTLFYVMLLFQQLLMLFIAAVGLFDLWIDFRKRIKPAQNAST
jgi:uncharacterized protein YybS (DUF2232 family)